MNKKDKEDCKLEKLKGYLFLSNFVQRKKKNGDK